MKLPIPHLLYRHTRERQRALRIPADSEKWPEEWKDIPYKEYPRMEQTKLPEPSNLSLSLTQAALARRTERDFDNTQSLTLQEISEMLHISARKRPENSSRPHPSGGGRYPIETYVLLKESSVRSGGCFHYNVKTHSLEKLTGFPSKDVLENLLFYPWSRSAPMVIFFTAVWGRSSSKYEDFALPLALLEAGHIAQNMLMYATLSNISACTLAGFDERVIATLIDEDVQQETGVHLIAFGKKQ